MCKECENTFSSTNTFNPGLCPNCETPLLPSEKEFTRGWDLTQQWAHNAAIEKGWWENDRNNGELIALMHSELSEGLEALRKDLYDNHVPEFKGIEAELADVVIRIMDMAAARKYRVGEAIIRKLQYNAPRPHKHGNNSF